MQTKTAVPRLKLTQVPPPKQIPLQSHRTKLASPSKVQPQNCPAKAAIKNSSILQAKVSKESRFLRNTSKLTSVLQVHGKHQRPQTALQKTV